MTFRIEELGNYPKDEKGRPLVTDSIGRRLTVCATDSPSGCPLIIFDDDGDIFTYSNDGEYFSGEHKHRFDLIGPWQQPCPVKWDLIPRWMGDWVSIDSGGLSYAYVTEPEVHGYASAWSSVHNAEGRRHSSMLYGEAAVSIPPGMSWRECKWKRPGA